MNALIFELWFGGGGRAAWPSKPLLLINRAFFNRNSISNEIVISMSEEYQNEPRFFSRSGMLNRKLGEAFSLMCTFGNSNIAITIRHCNFKCSRVKTLLCVRKLRGLSITDTRWSMLVLWVWAISGSEKFHLPKSVWEIKSFRRQMRTPNWAKLDLNTIC